MMTRRRTGNSAIDHRDQISDTVSKIWTGGCRMAFLLSFGMMELCYPALGVAEYDSTYFTVSHHRITYRFV